MTFDPFTSSSCTCSGYTCPRIIRCVNRTCMLGMIPLRGHLSGPHGCRPTEFPIHAPAALRSIHLENRAVRIGLTIDLPPHAIETMFEAMWEGRAVVNCARRNERRLTRSRATHDPYGNAR